MMTIRANGIDKKVYCTFAVMVFLLLLLASCGKKQPFGDKTYTKLIGKWEGTEKGDRLILIFNRNKTARVAINNNPLINVTYDLHVIPNETKVLVLSRNMKNKSKASAKMQLWFEQKNVIRVGFDKKKTIRLTR